jgi:hypothetical protein
VTLDDLISQHGEPAFVKIDVEGYEIEVISGLSKAIKHISFEFSNEMVGETINCIKHLSNIGNCEWNLSYGETLKFNFSVWVSAQNMIEYLQSKQLKPNSNGDIYVRFIDIAS